MLDLTFTRMHAQAEVSGTGLRAVVFIASAINFELPNAHDMDTDRGARQDQLQCTAETGMPSVLVRPSTLQYWQAAKHIAQSKGVPCLLVLSKVDLLQAMSLPPGLSAESVEGELRSQFFRTQPIESGEGGYQHGISHNKSPEGHRGTLTVALSTCANADAQKTAEAECNVKSKAVNLLDDTVDLSFMLLSQAFPELDGEEEMLC